MSGQLIQGGRELSRKALAFDNNAEGFQKARDWAV